MSGYVVRGVISSAHGIRGLVKVTSRTDFPERLTEVAEWTLRHPDGRLETRGVEQVSPHSGSLLAKLDGIDDRTAAETLRGVEVVCGVDELPALPEGEWYHHQLIGLTMVTETGETIGVIEEILETGSNDVYVAGDVLIPALKEVIRQVDLARGEMVIRPLPGLLDR